MSGIYIKGMEMPKPKLADMATIYNAYILVDPNGRAAIVVDNEDGLDSTEYSLVLVQPHGRLIDADALKVSLAFAEKTAEWAVPALRAVLMVIDEMPTIIQAEEEFNG